MAGDKSRIEQGTMGRKSCPVGRCRLIFISFFLCSACAVDGICIPDTPFPTERKCLYSSTPWIDSRLRRLHKASCTACPFTCSAWFRRMGALCPQSHGQGNERRFCAHGKGKGITCKPGDLGTRIPNDPASGNNRFSPGFA